MQSWALQSWTKDCCEPIVFTRTARCTFVRQCWSLVTRQIANVAFLRSKLSRKDANRWNTWGMLQPNSIPTCATALEWCLNHSQVASNSCPGLERTSNRDNVCDSVHWTRLRNPVVVSYLGQKGVWLNGGKDTQRSHSSGRSLWRIYATCAPSSCVWVPSSGTYLDTGLAAVGRWQFDVVLFHNTSGGRWNRAGQYWTVLMLWRAPLYLKTISSQMICPPPTSGRGGVSQRSLRTTSLHNGESRFSQPSCR